MNLHNIPADARAVISDLRATVESDVLDELTGLVTYHRAQGLIAEAEGMIREARERVENIESELTELEQAFIDDQDKMTMTRARRDVMRRQRDRAQVAGQDVGIFDVAGIESEVNELERRIKNQQAEWTTLKNKRGAAHERVKRLDSVLRELQAVEEPDTPMLNFVWGRMGADHAT